MKISFCGGSGEVGGSCILLDCGIRPGSSDPLPDFRTLQARGGVDAVVLSHAHRDHSGCLPVLSRECPEAAAVPPSQTDQEAETDRMDQNAAFALIDQAFSTETEKPSRRGIKNDQWGKLIEVAFITPSAGERHAASLRSLDKESGRRIRGRLFERTGFRLTAV